MPTLRATVGRLDVHLRFSRDQTKRWRMYGDPEGRSRELLTIGAIADVGAARVDLGLVRHIAAVAGTLDFHRYLHAWGLMAPNRD